jgi:hypothetical protein
MKAVILSSRNFVVSKYALIGSRNHYVEISYERFESLKLAQKNLLEALSIEDKLNLVLENYYELEQEVFKKIVRNMSHSSDNWSISIDELYAVNRRLINLLATGSLYVSQVRHNIGSIYGVNSKQKIDTEKMFHDEYDLKSSAYRIVHEIRNYIQHHEFPTRILNSGMRRVKTSLGSSTKHTASLCIDVEFLAERNKSDSKGFRFNSESLEALQNLGKSVEVAFLVRQYLESIGKMHLKIRELLGTDLMKWEELIHSEIKCYQETTGKNDTEILRAISTDESESGVSETIFLFKDFMERRHFLEDKNKYLTHYSSHFISNESPLLNDE